MAVPSGIAGAEAGSAQNRLAKNRSQPTSVRSIIEPPRGWIGSLLTINGQVSSSPGDGSLLGDQGRPMMQVNRPDGLTIAAVRELLHDSDRGALSVLIPVLEDILGGNVLRIRRFFETPTPYFRS